MNSDLLSQTSKRYRKFYIEYINSLYIDEKLKLFLTREKIFNGDSIHYLFYPNLFREPFGIKEDDHFIKVCVAGFLYFQSLIIIDKSFDDKLKSFSLPNLNLIITCQEESLKILARIFNSNSDFWELWGKRKMQHIKASQIELTGNPQSVADFKKLSDLKSSFGKVAIDVCYVLSDKKIKKDVYQNALFAHEKFSWANQIIDDIQDLQEDIEQKQPNFVHKYVTNWVTKTVKENLKSTDIKNYLYTTQLIFELLNQVQKNYKASRNSLSESQLWVSLINALEIQTINKYETLRAFQKINKSKERYSNAILSSYNTKSLKDQITKSSNFIYKEQNTNGSWDDFFNKAGFSNIWSTGFILSSLINTDGIKENRIDLAKRFLKKNKQGDLWGYNSTWIYDCDSSSLVLMSMLHELEEHKEEFLLWLSLQKSDGGFSTYSNKGLLKKLFQHEFKSFAGWTQSHMCVSAVAFYYLSRIKANDSNEYSKLIKKKYSKLISYILQNRKSNHLWDSYWWTSPIYSTSFILRGLTLAGHSVKDDLVLNSFEALSKLQNRDGSFSNRFSEKNSFFTALALCAFCTNKEVYLRFSKSANKAAEWLSKNQFDDGSFQSSFCLQIPAPNIIDPKSVKNWTKSIKVPVNVIHCDIMRLFSTSASLQALTSYSKYA